DRRARHPFAGRSRVAQRLSRHARQPGEVSEGEPVERQGLRRLPRLGRGAGGDPRIRARKIRRASVLSGHREGGGRGVKKTATDYRVPTTAKTARLLCRKPEAGSR